MLLFLAKTGNEIHAADQSFCVTSTNRKFRKDHFNRVKEEKKRSQSGIRTVPPTPTEH
jgi:hypothetical protein